VVVPSLSSTLALGSIRGREYASPRGYTLRPFHDLTPSRPEVSGTSVGSADAIARVGRIVARAAADRPVVVVSAVGGVTNELIRLGETALARGAWEQAFEALRARHATIQTELLLQLPEVDAPAARAP